MFWFTVKTKHKSLRWWGFNRAQLMPCRAATSLSRRVSTFVPNLQRRREKAALRTWNEWQKWFCGIAEKWEQKHDSNGVLHDGNQTEAKSQRIRNASLPSLHSFNHVRDFSEFCRHKICFNVLNPSTQLFSKIFDENQRRINEPASVAHQNVEESDVWHKSNVERGGPQPLVEIIRSPGDEIVLIEQSGDAVGVRNHVLVGYEHEPDGERTTVHAEVEISHSRTDENFSFAIALCYRPVSMSRSHVNSVTSFFLIFRFCAHSYRSA